MKKKIKNRLKKIMSLSLMGIYESIRDKNQIRKRDENQKRLISFYISSSEEKKLQIGCGSNVLPGWLNTDLDYSEQVAFMDAGNKFPISSETFDFVYSEHLFEHLKVEQQINMLNESFRILKKGGIMRIATPSLKFLHDLYENPLSDTNEKYVKWNVTNMPGQKAVRENIKDNHTHYAYIINHFFKAWGHQMIHNFSTLSSLSMQSGFKSVKECRVGISEYPSLQGIEKHGTIIPEWMNEIETMVVEIVK